MTTEKTTYFRLMATDGSPDFEPTGHFQGSWFGVAAVVSPTEVDRLKKRGCTEITQATYDDLLKKKPEQPANSPDFRPAWAPQVAAEPAGRGRFDGLKVAIESADKATPVAKPDPEPRDKVPSPADLSKAAPVPVPVPGRHPSPPHSKA